MLKVSLKHEVISFKKVQSQSHEKKGLARVHSPKLDYFSFVKIFASQNEIFVRPKTTDVELLIHECSKWQF